VPITEDTFLAMLQKTATIIPKILPKEIPELIKDPIVDLLERPELRDY